MKSQLFVIAGLIALGSLLGNIAPANATVGSPRAFSAEGGSTIYSLNLLWVNPDYANLDHINIYLSTVPLTEFGLVGVATGIQALPNLKGEFTITGLVDQRGTANYYYTYITAVDKFGNEGPPTNTLKRQTGISSDLTGTLPVSNLAKTTESSTSIGLSWFNPSENDLYQVIVYRSTALPVADIEANLVLRKTTTPNNTETFFDSNLMAETTYHYTVYTLDVADNYSEPATITVKTPQAQIITPPAPHDVIDIPVGGEQPLVLPNPQLFDYNASWISQSGTLNSAKTAHVATGHPGDSVSLSVTVKNTGKSWWYFNLPDDAHRIKLGTWGPQDRVSQVQGANWLSSNRATKLDQTTATGGNYTFTLNVKIPANASAGTIYKEYFRPVAEYVFWFGPEGIFWEIQVI